MKNKIVPFFVISILVLSGLGAVAINNDDVVFENFKTMTLEISPLVIEEYDDSYIEVNLEDTSSLFAEPGKPVLPKVVKSIELPFGVTNVKVDVMPINVQEKNLIGEIRPGPAYLPLTAIENNVAVETVKDEKIYTSEELFPISWYDYHIGCGRNIENDLVTFVSIYAYPARYNPAQEKLIVAESFDIKVSYEGNGFDPLPTNTAADMVIIAPSKFSSDLQKLINHKNGLTPPITTILKTTEEIYAEYSGIDKPEQIKYYIKDAIETLGIKYVLLVGGLQSLIYGIPRDAPNYGAKHYLVPVRYNNIYDNPKYPLLGETRDPGIISDLYYADIYKEGGLFEDWDPNGDGILGAWDYPDEGIENDTLDWYPDVAIGRLACRNNWEVRIMIDKIINHENNAYGKNWFNRMLVVSGDGFLDQEDIDVQWDTEGLPDGEYTIYAQSTNIDLVSGPIDEIHVTLNKTQESNITFNHDDHLKFDTYPFDPIAEITSPSNGNILGNTDFFEIPSEAVAYCNTFLGWADLNYTDEVMHIRGKSYDPQPYGVYTDIHVWVKNSADETVFEHTVEDLEMYYEGEWVTGEQLLKGGGGALYYMPSFEKNILWTTNGEWTGHETFADAFGEGCGFTFVSGHGAPTTWGNHVAGIPGNRQHAHIGGINIINWKAYPPFFPMDRLANKYKNPVTLVGGCHNSQFNVSFITTLLNFPRMWTYGTPAPECWSWWLTRVSKGGSIATIGNTGLGYGVLGGDCNILGLDGGICVEFYKQYDAGNTILGDTFMQTQASYVTQFDMSLQEHGKSLSQWVLLGDPSLQLGGYETASQQVSINVEGNGINADGLPDGSIGLEASASGQPVYSWDLDDDGDFDDATGIYIEQTWSNPGVYWVGVKADYGDHKETTYTIVDIEHNEFPDKPSRPTGKTSVKASIPYTYKTTSSDPYDYNLYYIFDWGDGEFSFVGPCESGKEISDTHIYKEKGSYEIKVMAVNIQALWSEWSESLTVSVTKSKSVNSYSFLQFLQKIIENYPNSFPILRQLLGL
jgi:hypothetical protein